MAFEVVVPQMGESVLEGTIVEWKVVEGDKVKVNQPLVEIMTDKVNVEIPSGVEGVVEKILAKPGEVVPVGRLICTIAVVGEVPAAVPAKDSGAKPAAKAASPSPASRPTAPVVPAGQSPVMAPAVRKLARDYGLDPAAIVGTGPEGRITHEDVEKAAAARSVVAGMPPSVAKPAVPGSSGPAAQGKTKYAPPPRTPEGRIEERLPLEGARKLIAEHMVRSRRTSAHVTTFEDCDFTALVEFRGKVKDQFRHRYGARLTYLPFIMKAAVECLKEYPTINASMTETEIILKKYYHIGVAVARESGLIVPVVHDADRKSIIELAIEINDLGERARHDQLTLDEVQGGTFTLTNAGMFGATASTPVINQPQVAVLGIHNIAEKPVVRDGQIVIRYMSTFGMSFDHRLIDGHTAVQFLHMLIGFLENPGSLLLRLR